MVRVLTAGVLLCAIAAAAQEPQPGRLSAGLDAGWVDAQGNTPWTDGSVGKLLSEGGELTLRRGFLDYAYRLTDTIELRAAAEAYDDDLGPAVDLTEAWAEWRPVPSSPTRYRLRAGAFFPRVSLENTEAGWTSPYTLAASAINTWVAEELRSLGAELSVSRRPAVLGGNQEFAVHASVFLGSDPAGSLLAWRGWSAHGRQTRFGDELPLPPLPQIQPGMMFEAQDPYVTPLREIDDQPGYAVTADWQLRQRLQLRAGRYDNRADPEALVSGQYGWRTRFTHLGLQATLPGGFGVLGQAMTGSTVMGPVMNGAHVVDTSFDAWFLMLTYRSDRHRLSLRRDDFSVTDNDQTPLDDNSDDGSAWTASYRYTMSENLDLVAEYLRIRTHHPAWAYYSLDPLATEQQWQLIVRLAI